MRSNDRGSRALSPSPYEIYPTRYEDGKVYLRRTRYASHTPCHTAGEDQQGRRREGRSLGSRLLETIGCFDLPSLISPSDCGARFTLQTSRTTQSRITQSRITQSRRLSSQLIRFVTIPCLVRRPDLKTTDPRSATVSLIIANYNDQLVITPCCCTIAIRTAHP